MADYYAVCRSSYFAVKDPGDFKTFCADFGLHMLERGTKLIMGIPLPELHGFYVEDGGLPDMRHDKDSDECDDVDFLGLLATHLVTGHVAVIQETGHEKMRYMAGLAWAVNSAGEIERVSLTDIYDKAARLGEHVTDATY